MKYRDAKKKSNISTKFSKEFQFTISISSFCGFDKPVENKLHFSFWFLIIGLTSHMNPGEFAGVWTFFYVKSVVPLLYVEILCSVAFVLIRANVVQLHSKWGLTSKIFNTSLKVLKICT